MEKQKKFWARYLLILYITIFPWIIIFIQFYLQCLEGIPREAYYLATKVGRYEKDPKLMFDFSAEKTRKSIEESLKRLNVDYFDILQVSSILFKTCNDVD